MWMREYLGERINEIRTREMIEARVDLVTTSCPYCLTMVEDGIKSQEMGDRISVQDLAEVLYRSIR